MHPDSISAGTPDYVRAAVCLNILEVDLGRNELRDPCTRASVYTYICVCVYACI